MKELQVQFMTFCDHALTGKDNKLSIIGIFDEIRVSQFPGGLPSAALVAIVKGKPDTSYTLSIQGGKGKTVLFKPIELSLRTGSSGASNITMNLQNIGFAEPGEYDFTITEGEKEVGHTILHVKQVKEQEEVTYKLPN